MLRFIGLILGTSLIGFGAANADSAKDNSNNDYIIKEINYSEIIGKTQNEFFAKFDIKPSDNLFASESVEIKDGKIIAIAKTRLDLPLSYECPKPVSGYKSVLAINGLYSITYENGKIINITNNNKNPQNKIIYTCKYYQKSIYKNDSAFLKAIGYHNVITPSIIEEIANVLGKDINAYYQNLIKLSELELGEPPKIGMDKWQLKYKDEIIKLNKTNNLIMINFAPEPKHNKSNYFELVFDGDKLIKIKPHNNLLGRCYLSANEYNCERIK